MNGGTTSDSCRSTGGDKIRVYAELGINTNLVRTSKRIHLLPSTEVEELYAQPEFNTQNDLDVIEEVIRLYGPIIPHPD